MPSSSISPRGVEMRIASSDDLARLKGGPGVQMDLFGAVISTYLDGQPHTNEELYERLQDGGQLSAEELRVKVPVGKSEVPFNIAKRRVRWWQQTLRERGIIERVPEVRGTWRLAERNKNDLTVAPPQVMLLAHSTELGAAIWGSCFDFFEGLQDNIAVCVTSPPYPLAQPRAYGNPAESEWVDFMCRALEPIVKRLVPGGSIAVNLTNDCFDAGSPSRSLYKSRFILAMADRLSMALMDECPWVAGNKAPGPYQWASRQRMQLNTGYEPVLIFCNDPLRSFADNRRVLEPHSESHKLLMAAGGERKRRVNSDGAYRVREGAYGATTAGRIPRNVLQFGTTCADNRRMRKLARAAGLPLHGASMPLALAMFLVQYLSRPGDLVVDPFGGALTTAKACEELGRLWYTTEIFAEYVMGGRFRFGVEELAS